MVQDMWDHGLSLVEVWRAYKGLYVHEHVSFAEACTHYLKHLQEQGRSPAYIKSMGWVLDEFKQRLGDSKGLSFHTTFALQRELKNTSNKAHKASRLGTFYLWAKKQHYIQQVPDLSLPKKSTAGTQVGFLTVPECASLIQACPLELQGHLWLRLCMGLRVAEAGRVEDLEERDGFLIVGAKAAKTRTRRVIELLPGHVGWWLKVRPLKSLRERFEALRHEAGLTHWPNNAMRHTAASHWLNYYQDEGRAALHLGNSPTMLHRHYKALVTRADSKKFFELWEINSQG